MRKSIPILDYIESLFITNDERNFDVDNFLEQKQEIQVSRIEGKIISILLLAIRAKSVLEIGTLFGYSTKWILSGIQEQGIVYSIEKSTEHYNLACKNLSEHILNKSVKLINAEAKLFLESPNELPNKFDAVFIDANKAAYIDYFEILQNMIKKGGILIADNMFLYNTFLGDDIYQKLPDNKKKLVEKMHKFSNMVSKSNSFHSIILPTPGGMLVAIKK